jgi:hypothetical protein
MPYKDSEGKEHNYIAKPGTKKGDSYCARTQKVNGPNGTEHKVDCSGVDKNTTNCKRRKAWGCSGAKSKKKG